MIAKLGRCHWQNWWHFLSRPFQLLPYVIENNVTNIVIAVVLLFVVGLTPNAYETLTGRVSGIAEVVNGVYQSRKLENQVAAKQWLDTRRQFSSAVQTAMKDEGISRGKLITDNLFSEFSEGLPANDKLIYNENGMRLIFGNPFDIAKVSLDDDPERIVFPLPESYGDVAFRFKIRRKAAIWGPDGDETLTLNFWTADSREETRFSFLLKSDQSSGAIEFRFAYDGKYNHKRHSLRSNATKYTSDGHLDVEILGVDDKVILFVSGQPVLESFVLNKPLSRQQYNSIAFEITGALDFYSLKDFTIAALSTSEE